MKTLNKFIAVLIVIIFITSSVYVVFYMDDGDSKDDNTSPKIDSITGDTTGTTGKITSISVSFSDNVEVTVATIYYKSENADEWESASILSGNKGIEIPSDSDDDWFYYVTVEDAAGNSVGKPSTDGIDYYTITVTESVEDLTHTVFIEEGTSETCVYCPGVSETIHDLYNSGDYNFQYVSLVTENSKADKRLKEDYNIVANPTVYIDGGYSVTLGGGKTKEEVEKSGRKDQLIEAIKSAEQRTVPALKVETEIYYKNDSNNFTTNVLIKNYGEGTYTGTLKVYLVEIISRWKYTKTEEGVSPIIHNGFLDFIINEPVEVDAGGEYSSEPKNWDLTDLDPENLMVISVVFSSQSEQRFSSPNTEENPFDAYFADATNGTRVIAGNLPPQVVITNPVEGKLHIFGISLFDTIFKTTRLIGKTNIVVNADDEDGTVEKVEFYIDDELISTDDKAPYEYALTKIGLLKTLLFRKHILKVIAYDNEGGTSTDELEICARI